MERSTRSSQEIRWLTCHVSASVLPTAFKGMPVQVKLTIHLVAYLQVLLCLRANTAHGT